MKFVLPLSHDLAVEEKYTTASDNTAVLKGTGWSEFLFPKSYSPWYLLLGEENAGKKYFQGPQD